MILRLRPAAENERDFCRRLHHAAYRDVVIRQFGAWDEAVQDEFFARAWTASPVFVIEADGERIGCLGRTRAADHVWIDEIQILPEFQGRGVGSELLRREHEDARRRGLPLRLQVLKANERARALYERLGFRETGRSERHIRMEWS